MFPYDREPLLAQEGTTEHKDQRDMKSELNNLKPQLRCLPVNLLDFLEADNSRLRRTVIELSLDVLVLRDALNGSGLRPNNHLLGESAASCHSRRKISQP
jgi:hypothetical protein